MPTKKNNLNYKPSRKSHKIVSQSLITNNNLRRTHLRSTMNAGISVIPTFHNNSPNQSPISSLYQSTINKSTFPSEAMSYYPETVKVETNDIIKQLTAFGYEYHDIKAAQEIAINRMDINEIMATIEAMDPPTHWTSDTEPVQPKYSDSEQLNPVYWMEEDVINYLIQIGIYEKYKDHFNAINMNGFDLMSLNIRIIINKIGIYHAEDIHFLMIRINALRSISNELFKNNPSGPQPIDYKAGDNTFSIRLGIFAVSKGPDIGDPYDWTPKQVRKCLKYTGIAYKWRKLMTVHGIDGIFFLSHINREYLIKDLRITSRSTSHLIMKVIHILRVIHIEYHKVNTMCSGDNDESEYEDDYDDEQYDDKDETVKSRNNTDCTSDGMTIELLENTEESYDGLIGLKSAEMGIVNKTDSYDDYDDESE